VKVGQYKVAYALAAVRSWHALKQQRTSVLGTVRLVDSMRNNRAVSLPQQRSRHISQGRSFEDSAPFAKAKLPISTLLVPLVVSFKSPSFD
jgi:hypothetical protein